MRAARAQWRHEQPRLDRSKLIFIDETGTSTNMTRLRGRAPRGQRLVAKVPHGHWKMTTFVAALRCDGITAPFVIDAPMNGDIFVTYIKQCVVPTLSGGEIVSMDNLPAHKVAGVREAIEAGGAELRLLPPYSPDLNPIEPSFAKLKAHLRKAGERSVPALWDRIGTILQTFHPAGMQQLLHPRRIYPNLTGFRSRPPVARLPRASAIYRGRVAGRFKDRLLGEFFCLGLIRA